MYIRPYDGRVNSDLWYPMRLRCNVSAPYMRHICICDAAGAIKVHRGARRLRVCGVPAVCPRHGAARHICDAFAIHFAGGRGGSAVQYHKRVTLAALFAGRRGTSPEAAVRQAQCKYDMMRCITCCSSERQTTVQHGGCAEANSRSCASHLRLCVKDRAFPQNGTFGMRDIPRIRANGGVLLPESAPRIPL